MIGLRAINHDKFNVRSGGPINDGEQFVAENVAYGRDRQEEVRINSASYKINIEGNHTYSGFGILKAAKGRYYFT
jgi:hypothetical protein